MTSTHPAPTLANAVLDGAVAITITFLPDHSLTSGGTVIAVWAGLSATVRAIGTVRQREESRDRVFGLLASGTGYLLAIALLVSHAVGTTPLVLAILLAANAILSAAIAWFSVSNRPRTDLYRKDEVLYAAISVLFAVVVLLVPKASVHVVGAFGLYLAVTAVFRAIAGLGYLRSYRDRSAHPTEEV